MHSVVSSFSPAPDAIAFTYRPGRRPSELVHLLGRWDCKRLPDGEQWAEQKIDGWRCAWFRGLDRAPALWTRNGHKFEGVGHIIEVLIEMERIAGEPMFFDGEFQVDGSLAATKAWCERGWRQGGEAGTLFLFDCLPLSDWEAGRCALPLRERRAMLERLFDEATQAIADRWEWREGTMGRAPAKPSVALIPVVPVRNADDALGYAADIWSEGGEGVVIKGADTLYVRGRSSDWLKVKR